MVLRAPNLSAKKGGMMRKGSLVGSVSLNVGRFAINLSRYTHPTPLMIITNVVDAVYGKPTSSMP